MKKPDAAPTRAEEVEAAFREDLPWVTVDKLNALTVQKYSAPDSAKRGARPSFAEWIPGMMFVLDDEVTAGGLFQFFSSESGDLCLALIRVLEEVRADEAVAVLERAFAVFPDGTPSPERAIRLQQLDAAGDRARKVLDSLTEPFRQTLPLTYARVKDYLSAHKNDFLAD